MRLWLGGILSGSLFDLVWGPYFICLELILGLCSGITPGVAQGTVDNKRIELVSVPSKTSTLPLYYLSTPSIYGILYFTIELLVFFFFTLIDPSVYLLFLKLELSK